MGEKLKMSQTTTTGLCQSCGRVLDQIGHARICLPCRKSQFVKIVHEMWHLADLGVAMEEICAIMEKRHFLQSVDLVRLGILLASGQAVYSYEFYQGVNSDGKSHTETSSRQVV